MLLGLLSSCTIVLLPVGVHFFWMGFLVTVAFAVTRAFGRTEVDRGPDESPVTSRVLEVRSWRPSQVRKLTELWRR